MKLCDMSVSAVLLLLVQYYAKVMGSASVFACTTVCR